MFRTISIEESKKVPFHRVLFAIGIRYVGETVAKTIASELKSIDNLKKAMKEEKLKIGTDETIKLVKQGKIKEVFVIVYLYVFTFKKLSVIKYFIKKKYCC